MYMKALILITFVLFFLNLWWWEDSVVALATFSQAYYLTIANYFITTERRQPHGLHHRGRP